MGKIKDFFKVKHESVENESLPLTPGVKRKTRDDDDENEDGDDARDDAEDERGSSDLVLEHAPNGAQSFPKKIRREKTVSSQWAWFMGDGQKKGMDARKPPGNKKVGGLVDLGN